MIFWSFVLAGIGVIGIWLIGDGHRIGYIYGIIAQIAWAIYSIFTHQYGFIVTCVALGYVYARGWMKARHRESE